MKIFESKVVNVETLEELEGGLARVRFTFDDGETIEVAAKHVRGPEVRSQ